MIQSTPMGAAAAALFAALLVAPARDAAAQATAVAPAKSASAAPSRAAAATLAGTGTIAFKGTSTLHDFEGQVAVQPFTIRISDGGRWSADATVPVAEMNTGNSKRDKSMYEMFELPSYPAIRGKLEDQPVPKGGNGTVTMTLQIRDKRQSVRVQVTDWKMQGGELSFHGTAQVSLGQFGLVPPSVLKMIKVADTVTLEGDFHAAAKGRTVAQGE
jgi:polyisoprenoid-binding protein YceI